MDIGLLLHTRQIIRQEEAARSFEQLCEDAAHAEQLGFDHIWLGDSVTVLDKARGDCLTTCTRDSGRNLEGPDYPRRQRRTGQRLHSTPIRGFRRAAARESRSFGRVHRSHAPALD